VHFSFKMTSGGNNFNDFPAKQRNKLGTNTEELIPVCHVTNQHYVCVYNRYSIRISTRSNDIQVCFSLFFAAGLWTC